MTPIDWREIRLGDLIQEHREKTTTQDQHLVLTSSRSGLILQSEYYSGGRIDKRNNVGFHVIPRGYITYRSRSDDGQFFFNKNNSYSSGIISHFYPVFKFKDNDEDFFLDFLNFHRSVIGARSVGSSQKVLSLNALKEMRFFLPPPEERVRISRMFQTWDRAIETMEALITNARAQKKALMQSLLTGKKRLRGFTGTWEQLTFGDVVEIDRSSLGQQTPADFRFRYISLSDVQPGLIARQLSPMTYAEAPSRARRQVKKGDILMATVRPNLQAFAKIGPEHADCIASTGFAVLSAKPGFDSDYLFQYLFSEHLTGQIEALVVGSNYPAINSTDIKGLAVRCPRYEEQAAIAEVLRDADREIEAYESQRTLLRREKSALMQQLLAGKRRVKVDRREAA